MTILRLLKYLNTKYTIKYLSINFSSICEHMLEKFSDKDVKKDNFSKQMELCKRSIIFQQHFQRYKGYNDMNDKEDKRQYRLNSVATSNC